MTTTITQWKALHHKDLITKVAPIHWDIDLTSTCNHRCPGCFYIGLPEDGYDSGQGVYRDVKNGMLPAPLVFDIIQGIKKVGGKAITFVGGGEPTLHPLIANIFNTVKHNGLKFGLISHLGLKYKSEFFDALELATWVRVSVNAATSATYAKMQGIKEDEFDRMLRNVQTCADRSINIGVSFLIHPDNVYEIEQAARLFKDAGAKYIQYKPYITDKKEKFWDGLHDCINEELRGASFLNSKSFQVLDQFSTRKQQLVDYWNKKECGRCWVSRFNPKITANGKVYQCCELAYSNYGILGDLNTNTLEEIVASPEWQKAEDAINTNQCPPCWERDLNKSINDGTFQQMEPPPLTRDFEFV